MQLCYNIKVSKNRLSHSSVNTYMSCPKKWQLHYKERLRSKYTSSALLFGSALDEAWNLILKEYNTPQYDPMFQTYFNIFMLNWREGYINKEKVQLYDNETLVYANADFDGELLNKGDLLTLNGVLFAAGVACAPEKIIQFIEDLKAEKEAKGFESLSVPLRKFYNYANWLSLYHKGILMLTAYRDEVLPQIKKVLAVQKKITLTSDADEIIGYIDAVVEMQDGRVVVMDNKTSAREYEQDAVIKSPQLALYVHAVRDEFHTNYGGFCVLRKGINKQRIKTCKVCKHVAKSRAKTCDDEVDGKRCGGEWTEKIKPKAEVQMLINEIPPRLEEIVLEGFADINAVIKADIFPRNLNSCLKPFPCPYYRLCHENKMDDLVKLPDDSK